MPPVLSTTTRAKPLRILVTGGAGFIGSSLVERLARRGHRVTVLDSHVTAAPGTLVELRRKVSFRSVRQDVRDGVFGRFDQIYHLASLASPKDYSEDPILTLTTCAIGTQAVLESAARTGSRVLVVSTSEVYGDPLIHPQHEDYFGNVDPLGPRSAYDEGKRYAEALSKAFSAKRDVDVRIARVFNTYGPRMRPDDGRMPAAFITAALLGAPIPIDGSGRQTRSLCYVDDTVLGLIAAMEKGERMRVYNIGNPEELSVADFARLVIRLTGARSGMVRRPARTADIRRRRPDITRALHELGWKPRTSLAAGLRRTIRWYREHMRAGAGA
jgi:dTDP-glucose 4,6-dehydratase